eukprot:TRINITY_DN1199_c0_g1_i3.p1 TRINITY_DN1199_c0_g1~~TRINITY_DN1199_c0_g1_i3.p1  ORF type:complete len:1012 (-),score=233.88 TRINITY_DN1199_c0_g1_i3:40-3075(-)
MLPYTELRFRQQVERAIRSIKTVLENNKTPECPTGGGHTYDDKYALVELVTNTAVASQVTCLELLGLDEAKLKKLKQFAQDRSVTLRLKVEEKCTFVRQTERQKESSAYVTEKKGVAGKSTTTEKVITKFTDYFWKFEVEYELFAFRGNDIDDKILLIKRCGQHELKTSANVSPHPKNTVIPSMDVNITWLLNKVGDKCQATFSIDRFDKACHTPRRNPEVEEAITYFSDFYTWAQSVSNYFKAQLFPKHSKPDSFDFNLINSNDVLVPCVPLFVNANRARSQGLEKEKKNTLVGINSDAIPGSPVFHASDLNKMLAEQSRGLRELFQRMEVNFSNSEDIIAATDAKVAVIADYFKLISQHYYNSVEFVEDLIRKQLISAIGRELSPVDFNTYMAFHNKRLFKKDFRQYPFSYPVRFEDNAVEGTVSIEAQQTVGSDVLPIFTHVRGGKATVPMKFALDASSYVSFYGERYVHGWVSNQFAGKSGISSLNLVSRARQFCSYIVMVGRIVSADVFQPTFSMLVRNKDEIKIPLELETIPTPKEFADAIASLSPEQQRFAKAFRAMKLSSTLFGVAVIQIKPQLEKLLNLPYGSLAKEISLTQRLLDLFITYQIPSDLVSYDGPRNLKLSLKIKIIETNVSKIEEMVATTKQEQLLQHQNERLFQKKEKIIECGRKGGFFPVEEAGEVEHDRAWHEGREGGGEGGEGGSIDFEECEKSVKEVKEVEEVKVKRAKRKEKRPEAEGKNLASCEKEQVYKKKSTVAKKKMDVRAMKEREEKKRNIEKEKERERRERREREREIARKQKEEQDMREQEMLQLEKEYEEARRLDEEEDRTVKQEEKEREGKGDNRAAVPAKEEEDLTAIPTSLESKFEELDEDSALRPTIINPGQVWTKKFQKTLLSPVSVETIRSTEQEAEKKKTFDLLDALSRSGSLDIDYASLHVVVASTHCFAESLMNTVVKDNINPIEKVERSNLIIATTIHQKAAEDIIKPDQVERVRTFSPKLFMKNEDTA